MTTYVSGLYNINGVISTDKSVLQNLNALCTSAGSWMTYDISDGKWSVVINRAGSSAASFTDSNIIGGINVSSTGINDLYNSATIEFPHKDLRDQTDYIDFDIPTVDRFPNELDNRLSLRIDLLNDPIQAAYIASAELKQSRVDKIIEFRTDFSKLGLKAGDLIDVTNTVYGYTNKMFRITKMQEEDAEGLVISITALEYNSDVYSTDGLTRTLREKKTGIVPKAANQSLTSIDNQASLKLAVTPSAQAQGISLFYSAAASAGLAAATWYVDYAGKRVSINASDVVISWTFDTGSDLDIRCRIVSPDVGQNILDDFLGYTGTSPTTGTAVPPFSLDVWPIGATKGSGGTAYIEWGGDNEGVGEETIRVDIDRIKAAYPGKRYLAIECRGNWYVTPGSTPVLLQAALYQGGTTTVNGSFGFTNVGATRTRILDSQGVYIDSFHGENVEADGFTGFTAPGELMGYFVFDTVSQEGQFVQTLPPGITA